jgi:hypothetical protein
MKTKRFFRKIHRWLGLLMALQIIAWMASGLWFSMVPIEVIRGEHLTHPPQELDLKGFDGLACPAAVQEALDRHFAGPWTLSSMGLVRLDGKVYWRVAGQFAGQSFTRLVPGDGQGVVPMLTEAAADRRARSWLLTPLEPSVVEWIDAVEPDSEIRGHALPLWKVGFVQPESLNLYLDPWTGEILARRTDRWRVFDFFWMLHIMDFESRDDFSHPLLQIAAALGLIIALSGVVLWALTTRLLRASGQRAV